MEVYEQTLAGGRSAFSDFNRGRKVVVAAAEAMAFIIIRIYPDADADPADAVLFQQFKQVTLRACAVAVADAGFFERGHAGDVHAENEVLRQLLHGFHVQRVLLRTGGRGVAKHETEQDQQDVTHMGPPKKKYSY